jgi:glycosyltransferase involved in cell wall biosynthesis
MKIAVLSFYSGNFERGVENWTAEIANGLDKNNDVTVYQTTETLESRYRIISTKSKLNWNRKIDRDGFRKRIFLDYWSLQVAKWTLQIIPSIWKNKYDILIPTNGGWQVAMMRIITWLYGGKMVVAGHSGRGWDERNNLWCFPDTFVALTNYAKEWANKVNRFVKVVVISDGVNLEKFNVQGPTLDLGLERPVILAVGALEKGKRLELAIKAVNKLKKGSLLILGKGPEKSNLEKLGKKLLGKRFAIHTADHEKIPKYYRSCDLFTLPSWSNEAFGMVYLEAMACGLPVVATDDPVRKEIISDAGILTDPTDIDTYSKALKVALMNNWGDKPKIQAEKFSWENVIGEYEKLFKSLTER